MAHRITDDCIGCGLCATNCPVSAITGDFKDKPNIDEALCIDCGLCKSNCPRDAILCRLLGLRCQLPEGHPSDHGAVTPRFHPQCRISD